MSSPVLKQQPLTRQTGAYPIELTGGFTILVVFFIIGKLNCKEDFFGADVGAILLVSFVALFLLRVPALCHGSLTFQKRNLTNN